MEGQRPLPEVVEKRRTRFRTWFETKSHANGIDYYNKFVCPGFERRSPEKAFGNGYFPLAKYYPSNVHLY